MDRITEFLEHNLLKIRKPQRYIGGELGSISRDECSRASFKFGFCFPEIYEIAESHLGAKIIYHILNKLEDVACERIYAPWVDMDKMMRDNNIPLFSLESRTPVKQFDILGFSLEYELTYTNVLEMLDLGGIPLLAEQRDEHHPLIIGGGPCSFNPEPLAPFFDAFYIGDAEQNLVKIVKIVEASKGETPQEKLKRLSQVPGVYVPGFYEPEYYDDLPQYKDFKRVYEDAPAKIMAQYVDELKDEFYPEQPIIPWTRVTHDRLGLELMRGCPHGCRFCMPGFIYRPLRERKARKVVNFLRKSINQTGWDEASLLSLSTTDYSDLAFLVDELRPFMDSKHLSLSLPSVRIECINDELLDFIGKGRKSGLTFAPEAGTDRLQKVINKLLDRAKFLATVEKAMTKDWNQVKLYFMLGLPTETGEDIEGIAELIKAVWKVVKKYNGRINITLSPFSPKAHTPFQWEGQVLPAEIGEKYKQILLHRFPRAINIDRRTPEVSLLEGIFSRGDRRLAQVAYDAWKNGATFDAWSEKFDFTLWERAFDANGIDYSLYTKTRDIDKRLPWSHIDTGVRTEYLRREREKAYKAQTSPSCLDIGGCERCNNCSFENMKLSRRDEDETELADLAYGRRAKVTRKNHSKVKYVRVKYAKIDTIRYISQLDLQRLLNLEIRKSGLPVNYSGNFTERPNVSFSSPLPLGYESEAEYFDIELQKDYLKKHINKLSENLEKLVNIIGIYPLQIQEQSLAELNCSRYLVNVPEQMLVQGIENKINSLLEKDVFVSKVKGKDLDIRPLVMDINFQGLSDDIYQVEFFLMNGEGGTLRPDELLKLWGITEEELLTLRLLRTHQFVYKDAVLKTLEGKVYQDDRSD